MERLTSVREALRAYMERLSQVLAEPEVEEIPVEEAVGRVLAEDVEAPIDLPPFDKAVMDGYAVRAQDTFGARPDRPVRLKLVGRALAGHPGPPVGPGECVEVSTGSMLPEGADAVVRYEHARDLGDVIEVLQPVPPGSCVDKAGKDVKAGQVVLERGRPIRVPDMAIMLALGLRTVRVFRKPRVAVMSVGDELVDAGAELEPGSGKVRDVDRPMVVELARELGAEPLDMGILPDDVAAIREAVSEALSKCDAVMTIGGASVGKPDLVLEALEGLEGIEVVVRRVSMRPGRPIILALAGRKPVICLPGPPVACFLAFQVFARPVLLRLAGVEQGLRALWPTIRARLARRVPSRVGFTDLIRVRLFLGPGGDVLAEPIATRGAGVLSSLVRANGILVVPEELDVLEEGSYVEVIPIGPFELVGERPGGGEG